MLLSILIFIDSIFRFSNSKWLTYTFTSFSPTCKIALLKLSLSVNKYYFKITLFQLLLLQKAVLLTINKNKKAG